MADPIREALCELCEAVQEQFFGADSDLSPRVIKATNEAALLLCRLDAQPTPTAARAALAAEPPTPAPAADGEREELADDLGWIAAQLSNIGWGDDSASVARAAALLRQPAPAPAADGEREELAALIEQTADSHNGLWPGPIIGKLYRAAALLRQLPPEGLLAVEYVHIDSGARIICEPNEECSGGHWAVLNSRHVNPCIEFRTVADAVAALQQARQQEVGDD